MTADFTLAQVRAEVSAISAAYAAHLDNDGTHTKIDELHREVLRVIAAGASDPAGLATEALRTGDIVAQVWCG